MGQPGMGQINTGISPFQSFYPYSGNLQQKLTNNTIAQGAIPLRSAFKNFDRPGVSRGGGNYFNALNQVNAAGSNAANQAGMDILGFHDANATMGLQAATAANNAFAGMAGLGNQLEGANIDRQNRIMQPYLSSLEQMFGGLMGSMLT